MDKDTIDFSIPVEKAKDTGYYKERMLELKWAIKDALTLQSEGKLKGKIIIPSWINDEED